MSQFKKVFIACLAVGDAARVDDNVGTEGGAAQVVTNVENAGDALRVGDTIENAGDAGTCLWPLGHWPCR